MRFFLFYAGILVVFGKEVHRRNTYGDEKITPSNSYPKGPLPPLPVEQPSSYIPSPPPCNPYNLKKQRRVARNTYGDEQLIPPPSSLPAGYPSPSEQVASYQPAPCSPPGYPKAPAHPPLPSSYSQSPPIPHPPPPSSGYRKAVFRRRMRLAK